MKIKFTENPTVSDPEREYYVSVTSPDDDDYRLAAGPFAEIGRALELVAEVERLVCAFDHRAHWYGYGTCSLPKGTAAKVVFSDLGK
jgi:hypothetical protein